VSKTWNRDFTWKTSNSGKHHKEIGKKANPGGRNQMREDWEKKAFVKGEDRRKTGDGKKGLMNHRLRGYAKITCG